MKFATSVALILAGSAAMVAAAPTAGDGAGSARPARSGPQSCGSWAVKYGGGANACGSAYSYTAGDNTMCASNGSNCLDICCTPKDPQLCGDWSVKNGGPTNACGKGYKYTATDEQECASNGSGCKQICCTKSKVPPVVYRSAESANAPRPHHARSSGQLCGSWSVANGGPMNACGLSYTYTAGSNTMCASNGSNCLDICCTPNDPQLCGDWSVQNGGPMNACGSGYTYTATDEQECAADGDGCQQICCTQNKLYRRAA